MHTKSDILGGDRTQTTTPAESPVKVGSQVVFSTSGRRSVKADTIKEAAWIFAGRMAHEQFGRRGDVRTCNIGSYAQDLSFAEFSAFIGTTKGHETTGHNVNFTVYAEGGAL